MPDIRPDSPVAVLWSPDQDSYNSGRARSRLEAAAVTTVGQLCAMTAEDVTDIPRAGKTVLAEIRRALTANGLHLAGERPPSRAAVKAAAKAGQAEAARKAARLDLIPKEPPLSVSPEAFAALVAIIRSELDLAAAADPREYARLTAVPRKADPEAFRLHPWTQRTVGQTRLAELTGYSAVSIRRYFAQARAAGKSATVRTMPLPGRDGRWVIGDLALWMATRNEGQARQIIVDDEQAAAILADIRAAPRSAAGTDRLRWGQRKEIARRHGVSEELVGKLAAGNVPLTGRKGAVAERGIRTDRDELRDFLVTRVAETYPEVNAEKLLGEAREAGLPTTARLVALLLPGIRAAEARKHKRPSGIERVRGESMRPDGLLYASEVAADWAIAPSALTHARERGDIQVAGWDGKRPLYDPARLRARKDRRRTPVDVSHPLARLEPGDEGYENR